MNHSTHHPNSRSLDASLCSSCGAVVPQNARFCPSCQASLQKQQPSCPNCGGTLQTDVLFCSSCNLPLDDPTLTNCPICGAPLREHGVFCPFCRASFRYSQPGETELAPPPTPIPNDPEPSLPPPAPKKRWGFRILAYLSIFYFILFFGVAFTMHEFFAMALAFAVYSYMFLMLAKSPKTEKKVALGAGIFLGKGWFVFFCLLLSCFFFVSPSLFAPAA